MNKQHLDEQPDNLPVPDGQERLATQTERDDVSRRIEGSHSTPVKNDRAAEIASRRRLDEKRR